MLQQSELNILMSKSSYYQQDVDLILSQLVQGIDQQYCAYWAHIVDKLLKVLQLNQKTKVLALVQKRIAPFNEISELTIVVMQNSIQTSNYKLGAKILSSPTVKFTHHQLQEAFFYLAGIISQGLRQFEEALRYYNLASQIGFQSHFYVDALKQKSLLDFRLVNDRPDRKGSETIISGLWSFLLNEGSEPGMNINPLIDDDAKCALRECPNYSLIKTMMNHQQTMTRIPFSMTPFKNVRQLLAVNERIDAFWIHEQGQYIVFKDKINYQSLNDQLRRRYDLVIQL